MDRTVYDIQKISDLNYKITRIQNEAGAETKLIVHVNRLKLVSTKPNEVIFAEALYVKSVNLGKERMLTRSLKVK
jgi:hypothetical protein